MKSGHSRPGVLTARVGVFVLSLVLVALTRAELPALDHAWELTSQMRAREAAEAFRPAASAGNREALLGAALAHLAVQPFTPERLVEAREQLQALVAANRDDETGIRARYELGRIRQLYDADSTASDAPELVELGRDHATHYLGQLATIKLVLHRLYALVLPATDDARLAQAEELRSRITDPGLLRDYDLVMGDAYLFFNDRRKPALVHYRAAEAVGIPDATMRATVLVQIGELARLEGQPEVAAAAYQKFLGEFRRDIRAFEVRRRLATIKAAP